MSTETNKIENALEEGLVKPTVDLMQDYSELGLDAFLDNPVLKEIPLVKTVVGAIRGVVAIREIFLAKKLLTFLREYHGGKLSKEKRSYFLEKFASDIKYRK